MDELQNVMWLLAVFLTSACTGFIVGIHMSTPVKKLLLEQVHRDLLKHLREMRRTEEKKNAGGFRIVTGGRDD